MMIPLTDMRTAETDANLVGAIGGTTGETTAETARETIVETAAMTGMPTGGTTVMNAGSIDNHASLEKHPYGSVLVFGALTSEKRERLETKV